MTFAPASSTSPLYGVYSAYLQPLLQKHETGKPILYEDLQSSYLTASKLCLSNTQLREQLNQLHKSQLREYQKHATMALQKWFSTATGEVPMPEPSESEGTVVAYVAKVLAWAKANLLNKQPNYHLDDADTALPRILQQAVQARATSRFLAEKKESQEQVTLEQEETGKESAEEDEPMEGDEEAEDGEIDNEDDNEEGEEQEEDNAEDQTAEDTMATIPEDGDGDAGDDEDDEEDGEVEEGEDAEEDKKPETTPAKKKPSKARAKGKMGNKGKSNSTASTNKTSTNSSTATLRNKKALGGKRKPLPSKALGKGKRQRAAKTNK
mmetsp:Transcript_29486/g.68600  ORF Transcript_29486/g.68600 Transcript_29486/m.68600 type:complete len:323 (+) Transcript_29486:57-1025(+)